MRSIGLSSSSAGFGLLSHTGMYVGWMTPARRSTSDESRQGIDTGQTIVVVGEHVLVFHRHSRPALRRRPPTKPHTPRQIPHNHALQPLSPRCFLSANAGEWRRESSQIAGLLFVIRLCSRLFGGQGGRKMAAVTALRPDCQPQDRSAVAVLVVPHGSRPTPGGQRLKLALSTSIVPIQRVEMLSLCKQ